MILRGRPSFRDRHAQIIPLRQASCYRAPPRYYNLQPGQFHPVSPQPRQTRLYQQDGALFLDLPSAEEAVVPQRPQPWLPPAREAP